MKKLPLSEIYFDHELYPRQRLSEGNVSRLLKAMESGAKFPPIIVDKHGRGVDGAHRCEVYRRLHDGDFQVEVEIRSYKSDREFALDSVRVNNEHGLHLSEGDKTHCEMLLQSLGFKIEEVSRALGRPVAVIPSKPVATYEGKRVPLKPAFHQLAGQALTPELADANRKSGGHTQIFTLNQVVRLFETGQMRRDSPKLNDLIGKVQHLCLMHLSLLEEMQAAL